MTNCLPSGRGQDHMETFLNIPPEISLERLKLQTSNLVYQLARCSISLVMPDYPPSGRGQGHVTNVYILGPRPYLCGVHESRHFRFGLQSECKEKWHCTC